MPSQTALLYSHAITSSQYTAPSASHKTMRPPNRTKCPERRNIFPPIAVFPVAIVF